MEELETGPVYVGFWARVLATLVDSLLLLALTVPLGLWLIGPAYWEDSRLVKGPLGFVIEWLLPALAIVACWLARSATPGKLLIGAQIVDANTGAALAWPQALLRYLGYYLAAIPLLLGIVWVAFDTRKQGWHDKLARTVVVYRRPR